MNEYFNSPKPVKISQRSSTITNSFVNAIGYVKLPTEDEIITALNILGIDKNSMECIYCGGPYTEWDHLRPLVEDKRPTGFITEIQNLVPSCGKCNQSKGNKYWKDWINSDARQSPKNKNVPDLNQRIEKLNNYENWKPPTKLDYESIIGKKLWNQHWENLSKLHEMMKMSQELADSINTLIFENEEKKV